MRKRERKGYESPAKLISEKPRELLLNYAIGAVGRKRSTKQRNLATRVNFGFPALPFLYDRRIWNLKHNIGQYPIRNDGDG
jgi:hypothetical protein